jgi:hypothetical protein
MTLGAGTSTVTFGGVSLKNPSFQSVAESATFSESELNAGGKYVQGGDIVSRVFTFNCFTDSMADITALTALYGTEGSLVIDAETIQYCYIRPPITTVSKTGKYKTGTQIYQYQVIIVEDTRV